MLAFAVLSLEANCEDLREVVPVRFWVVAANFENFGDESFPWPAFQLNKHVQGIGDVAFNGAIGQFDAALENATCETRKCLGSGACVNG